MVLVEAAAGDPVAQGIIEWAGRDLGSLACGMIRRLKLETETFDLVLAAELGRPVHEFARDARLVLLDAPPVIGGVLLGMEAAGQIASAARMQLLKTTPMSFTAG